jgi:hypothetical protein
MTRGVPGTLAALTAVALACAAGAFGDVGYYVNKGRAPYPEAEEGEPEIRMAAEEVTITLYDDHVDVAATFDFANDGEGDRTVGMYFPLNVGTLQLTDEAAEIIHNPEEYNYTYDVTADQVTSSFRVEVDGDAVTYDLRDLYCDSDGFFDEVTANATWEVTFGAGEVKRVACSYSCYYGAAFMPSGCREYFYIVYTGGDWKGPIGRGVITIRPGEGFDWSRPLYARGVAMPPMRVYDDRIEWCFDDFEPVTPEIESYSDLGTGSGVEVVVPVTRGAYAGEGAPPEGYGIVRGDAAVDLPLHRKPSVDSELADGPGFIAEGWSAEIRERRGEWYRVKYEYGNAATAEGWARWYEYDDEAGEEKFFFEYVTAF